MSADFKITKDNRKAVLSKVDQTIIKALTACAMKAHDYAQDAIEDQKAIGTTGALHRDIDYSVGKDSDGQYKMVLGTNTEYAPYVETGTGVGYDGSLGGTGRKTPWKYKDESGQWHTTTGMEPRPFLRPAIADHIEMYQNIIQTEMKEL